MYKTYTLIVVILLQLGNFLYAQTEENKWVVKKVYKEQIENVNRSKKFESVIITTSQKTLFGKNNDSVLQTIVDSIVSTYKSEYANIERKTITTDYPYKKIQSERIVTISAIYDTPISMSLSARKALYYNKWNKLHKNRAILNLGVSYTPAIATRSVFVGVALPDDRGRRVNDRNETEYASFGWRYDLNIGLKFRLSHTFYANPFIMRQGFASVKKSVDWASGITYDSPMDYDYAFKYYGVALGYRFNGHKRKINFIYDVAVYYMLLDKAKNLQDNGTVDMNRKITGRNEDAFGIRSGIGFNYSPGYKWELFFLPNVSINASSLNRNGAVKTYLRNTGISVGTSFLFLRTNNNKNK